MKGLAIHGHLESNIGYHPMHVGVKYQHDVGVIGLLKRKESIPPLLTDDGEEMSILEYRKVDRTLDLISMVTERIIKTIT